MCLQQVPDMRKKHTSVPGEQQQTNTANIIKSQQLTRDKEQQTKFSSKFSCQVENLF